MFLIVGLNLTHLVFGSLVYPTQMHETIVLEIYSVNSIKSKTVANVLYVTMLL